MTYKLPPVVTASTWSTALRAVVESQGKRQGATEVPSQWSPTGTLLVPHLTNREAAALIGMLSQAAALASDDNGWPIWYQFAAVAYDWDPDGDVLNAGVAHGEKDYPLDVAAELWDQADAITKRLDKAPPGVPPRFEFDPALFSDKRWQNVVAYALREDGAKATVKHPSPFCRDKRTGKYRVPRPRCDKDGRGPVNPLRPMERLPCDNDGDCAPLTIRDPFTAMGSGLATLVAIGLVIWLSTEK